MTFIEFYDNTEAENICACLAYEPERLILVGPKLDLLNDRKARYEKLLHKRNIKPQIICRCVNRNQIKVIIDQLSELVETYDDCAFDLTGGEDLYLTAVGIVTERYSARNIQMHRFNFHSGTVYDCDLDGVNLLEMQQPKISVEENVSLYGGDVVYENIQAGTTPIWDMTPEFSADIRTMWGICTDPSTEKPEQEWNVQIDTLGAAASLMSEKSDPLFTRVSVQTLRSHMEHTTGKYAHIPRILEALRDKGLLTRYCFDGDTLEVVYKDRQVKKCLTTAGRLLEMVIYLASRDANKNGIAVYQDTVNGACIDWDGEIKPKNKDTRNEIDVLMMHGMIPVFVSCKNGGIDNEELYKLNTVAQYFGGRYAKKVLVAPALRYLSNAATIKERAAELNIRVEDELPKNWDKLCQKVGAFWSNT